MKVIRKAASTIMIIIGLSIMIYSVYNMNQWRFIQSKGHDAVIVFAYEGVIDESMMEEIKVYGFTAEMMERAELEALNEKQALNDSQTGKESQSLNAGQVSNDGRTVNETGYIESSVVEEVFVQETTRRKDYDDGMMVIGIPKIDVKADVMDGTATSTLKLGPGLYDKSPLVDEENGNVLIAGHRTTYGQWFRHVDQLEAGDPIIIEFNCTKYIYEVERVFVVAHNDWSVTEPQGYSALTLTACHPLGSAEQRIVVRAKLVKTVQNDKFAREIE